MFNNWKNICLDKTATLRETMQILNEYGLRIVLVTDNRYHLLGTVTDGDIRRGLLSGLTLDSYVSIVMNINPLVAFTEYSSEYIQAIMKSNSLLAMPIVDVDNTIVGLEIINSLDVQHKRYSSFDVVIMAGGIGKRLYPLTEDTPKPMLKLGTKPILEHIVSDLILQGFKNFYISTYYKSNIIKDYFKSGQHLGINIEYIEEKEPMGTAGVLYFLKNKINSPFIVMNGDLLVKIDFRSLIDFHKNNDALATMCIRKNSYQIPYGVVELEGVQVKNILEKPLYSHFISAGIYCFNHSVFNYINKKIYIDMPNLFNTIISNKENICAYLIHEYWADIGNMDSLNRVREDYKSF